MYVNVILAFFIVSVYLLFPQGVIGRLLVYYRYRVRYSVQEVPSLEARVRKASYVRRNYRPCQRYQRRYVKAY